MGCGGPGRVGNGRRAGQRLDGDAHGPAPGERCEYDGLKIIGVPTSVATAELACHLRIPLRDLDDVSSLDLNLDGADEIDRQFRMVKGLGGALLREKIVACSPRAA